MFLIFKKKKIFLLLVVILLLATFLGFQALPRKIPIYNVARDDGKIALSFDAAWGADKTLEILDVLDKNQVKATFFLVGFWCEKYPGMVKEIEKRGHEIGTHSQSHPHFNKLSKEETEKEIDKSLSALFESGAKSVKVFRPPFGEYNNVLLEVLEERKISCIQWDVDSLDWKGLSAKEIYDRVTKRVKSGSIILMHNNSDHVVNAIELLIPSLKAKGFEFAKMSDLILENGFVDSQGTQRPPIISE